MQYTLAHLMARIALGLSGATAALTGLILMSGMRKYWESLDESPNAAKKLWFWILTLGVNLGACAYCFVVFFPQKERSEENCDQC